MKIKRTDRVSVILPKEASERELFAAEELKKYLSLITGADFHLCTRERTEDDLKIVIGSPDRNDAAERLISADDFIGYVSGAEGIFIKDYGDTLLVSGGMGELERGTVYAVYELLERFCGCSFAAYTSPEIAGGEFIPEAEILDLDGIFYVKSDSDIKYRTAIIQFGDAAGDSKKKLNLPFFDWLVKNRYNRILTWMSVYEELKETGMLSELARRGIKITTGHHGTVAHFLPPYGNSFFPEKYYETHPEYYRLKADGERFLISGVYGQCVLCSRNEEMHKTLAENIISWIKDNPLVDTVALWPQDGTDADCLCESCKKHTKVENYTFFMNSVSELIAREQPEIKIDMLIYTDLWECPEKVKLNKNLMVDEAFWHESGLRRCGSPDGSCIEGTLFENNILRWHASGATAVYYDYQMGVYGARNRYAPMADEHQSMAKRFLSVGIGGSGTQIECFNLWNNLFNFYSFARTQYDTSLSMEDNLSRFSLIFGKGAEYIKEIIRLCEDAVDGAVTILEAGRQLMQKADKESVYKLFDMALNAESHPLCRNNIRMLYMAFRYTDLELIHNNVTAGEEYHAINHHENISPELLHMTRFDSFHYNNPGCGIMIPVSGEANEITESKWYKFD